MELYRLHRPKTLKGILGQDDCLKVVKGWIKDNNFPHVVGLFGPTGCGKTTLARAIAPLIGCEGSVEEINCADFKGIETARQIRHTMTRRPIGSKARGWIIDECFPGQTRVDCQTGSVPICSLQRGDVVTNIEGPAVVRHVFCNKVSLDRIVRLHFSDGRKVITTRQHLFLTCEGWREAQDLQGTCILSAACYIVSKEVSHAKDMRVLSRAVSHEAPQHSQQMLFQVVRSEDATATTWKREAREEALQGVRNGDNCTSSRKRLSTLLQPILCQSQQAEEAGDSTSVVLCRDSAENQRSSQATTSDKQRSQTAQGVLGSDEEAQPFLRSQESGEGKNYQGAQWNSAHMERKERRQRTTDAPAAEALALTGAKVAPRSVDQDVSQESVSIQVCSGHRETTIQNRHRDRRSWAQIEADYLEGREENSMSRRVRVDCVEIYERGSNDSAFDGTITDQDRTRGYAEFYDLEIEGHPSYFVEGLPVHNCHRLPSNTQDAFLKILEDPPSHCYFFFCTTEPQSLLKTLRGRMTTIQLKPVSHSAMELILRSVIAKEKIDTTEHVLQRIINVSEGSARNALQILGKIRAIDDEEEQLELVQSSALEQASVFLGKALVDLKGSFKTVARILKETDEDPERLRRGVLAYCGAIMLNSAPQGPFGMRVLRVMRAFRDHFYDCEKDGLILACYEVFLK